MISSYMPHGGLMILVDEILEYASDYAILRSVVKENNPFLENEKLPSYVLAEVMAQSLVVLRSFLDKNQANKLGFLLGMRNFKILKPYSKVNDEILTKISVSIQDENGLGIYNGLCKVNDEIITTGTITALNPEKKYLDEIIKKSFE